MTEHHFVKLDVFSLKGNNKNIRVYKSFSLENTEGKGEEKQD